MVKIIALMGVPLTAGHGGMVKPSSLLDGAGAFAGPPYKHGMLGVGCTGGYAPGQIEAAQGCLGEWYTNYTFIPGKPTLKKGSPLLTLRDDGRDWTKRNPWRAPGTAPVFSPCGHDGGNPQGCPVGNPGAYPSCGAGGYGHGPDGRTLPANKNPEVWPAGSVQEVAWGVVANHGGGYQYRIAKVPVSGSFMDISEEDFQKTPLPFHGDTQWTQRTNDSLKVAFPAMRTSTGTHPAGSTWTRNPVPGCVNNRGQPYSNGADGQCKAPQFPPPASAPWLFGFNPDGGNGKGNVYAVVPENAIIDQIQVPSHLEPGDYLVSFRYDCEQTSQVWQQCGSVRIVASESVVV